MDLGLFHSPFDIFRPIPWAKHKAASFPEGSINPNNKSQTDTLSPSWKEAVVPLRPPASLET